MKISEMIKNLEYQKEEYGDNEVVISLIGEDKVLITKSDEINFTYFQVSREQDILIIGD